MFELQEPSLRHTRSSPARPVDRNHIRNQEMGVFDFALLCSLLASSAHCFSINAPLFPTHKGLSLRCGRSGPAVATCHTRRARPIAMSVKTTADIETIKSDLLTQLSVGSGLKQAADQSNRIKVSETLLQLEPHNPTGTTQ